MSYYIGYHSIDDNAIIEKTKKVFSRTESGKNWKTKPDTTETEKITAREYFNLVNSVSFMNGFLGGYARAEKGYTYYGYIPVKITLINPGRTEKHVETYKFIK